MEWKKLKKLATTEYNNAANLSFQVCMECNDFTQEGFETFKSFVYDISPREKSNIYHFFLYIGNTIGKE